MHSRIFQISQKPISPDEYTTDFDYEGTWFTESIADSVTVTANREEDINWLEDIYQQKQLPFTRQGDMIIFYQGFKEQYFSSHYLALQKAVRDMTLKEFSNGMHAYRLQTMIEDKYGFYFDVVGDGLMTEHEFIRSLPDKEVTFYIGGVIDYHA